MHTWKPGTYSRPRWRLQHATWTGTICSPKLWIPAQPYPHRPHLRGGREPLGTDLERPEVPAAWPPWVRDRCARSPSAPLAPRVASAPRGFSSLRARLLQLRLRREVQTLSAPSPASRLRTNNSAGGAEPSILQEPRSDASKVARGRPRPRPGAASFGGRPRPALPGRLPHSGPALPAAAGAGGGGAPGCECAEPVGAARLAGPASPRARRRPRRDRRCPGTERVEPRTRAPRRAAVQTLPQSRAPATPAGTPARPRPRRGQPPRVRDAAAAAPAAVSPAAAASCRKSLRRHHLRPLPRPLSLTDARPRRPSPRRSAHARPAHAAAASWPRTRARAARRPALVRALGSRLRGGAGRALGSALRPGRRRCSAARCVHCGRSGRCGPGLSGRP